jgi:NAD-dependent dihydropyrimidine dehydrogenase PreA subunit
MPAHQTDDQPAPCYITTPIYYVNDRPHIGHCYTTLLADVAARAHRLMGREVFFLTGTDEHAEKVSKSAAEHGVTPMEWATTNAQRFKDAFAFMGFSNDDFVRTTEDRHTTRASAYIQALVDSGDIELGDYEGWYDPSQEEYVTESTAQEHDYNSPVTGKPLEKRTEQNYFFRLDKYEGWLTEQIESGAIRVLPEARKNEVMGRIRQGLNKVPVSRRIKEGDADWGIRDAGRRCAPDLCLDRGAVQLPDDRRHRRAPEVSGPEDRPLAVHLMAKDILWFHAVIWPCMLHALGEQPPATVYAHAYWIAEGRKMSKSLGNFIEIDQLRAYADRYSLDAVRWFLTTQGPLGATDADFAHSRFIEVYNSDSPTASATRRAGWATCSPSTSTARSPGPATGSSASRTARRCRSRSRPARPRASRSMIRADLRLRRGRGRVRARERGRDRAGRARRGGGRGHRAEPDGRRLHLLHRAVHARQAARRARARRHGAGDHPLFLRRGAPHRVAAALSRDAREDGGAVARLGLLAPERPRTTRIRASPPRWPSSRPGPTPSTGSGPGRPSARARTCSCGPTRRGQCRTSSPNPASGPRTPPASTSARWTASTRPRTTPDYESAEQLFIDPDTCIDCGLCVDECPVSAIYQDEDLPRSGTSTSSSTSTTTRRSD